MNGNEIAVPAPTQPPFAASQPAAEHGADGGPTEERVRHLRGVEVLGHLAGGAAHDFNNVLMALSAGVDLLERNPADDTRERILRRMREAVERGSSLTHHLLALSHEPPRRVEVVDLPRRMRESFGLLAGGPGDSVRVRTDLPADLWPVEVDASGLELAMLNLAIDARDALPGDGQILVEGANIEGLDDGHLVGDFVRLSMTGAGAAPRLEYAQVRAFAGAHGGDAHFSGEPAGGWRVDVLLPRGLEAAPPPPADQSNVAFADPDRLGCLLLVEDDPEVAAFLEEMITHIGYEVVRVGTSRAALGALIVGPPIDIVLSDVMIPGEVDGFALATEIRRRRPGAPIVLVSGYPNPVREQAREAGIALMSKPFRIDDLARVLETARAKARKPS